MSKFAYIARRYIVPADKKIGGLRLVFDIETDGLLEAVTKIHCIVVGDLDSDQVNEYGPAQITAGLAHLARADVLVGHNAQSYDLRVLRQLHDWQPKVGCTIVDTLIAGRLILPNVADLDDMTAAMGAPPFGKLRGRFSLQSWGARLGIPKVGTDIQDWSHWTPEMQQRCVGDVKICQALWRFLQPDGYSQEALALEHQVAPICEQITAAGVPFDVAVAEQVRQQWTARRTALAAQLQQQFPGVKLSSRQQIGALLEARGWVPERRTEKTKQPKIDDELLEAIPALYPEFAGLAEYMLLGRRLAQLSDGAQAWCKHVGADGRIHGSLVPIGTPHSRGKHLAPNLAAVPNPKKGKPFAAECRALFRAPDGWVFVCCDQAGLQDRGYAHYLADFDGGAYGRAFLDGADTHWQSAIALGLVPAGAARDKESKLHAALREGAKTFRYAFLYGCGALRAGQIIADTVRAALQIDSTSDLAQRFFGGSTHPNEVALKRVGKQALAKFEAATPGLRQLRESLQAHARRYGWLPGLDGRRVPVRALHSALNFIVTCSEAVICKRWLVRVHDELCAKFRYGWDGDFVISLWIHDEIAIVCRPQIAEQVGEILVRHAREPGEFYGFKVSLDAAFTIGHSWAGEPPENNKNNEMPMSRNPAFDVFVPDPLDNYFEALGSPEPGSFSDYNCQLSLAVDLAASSPILDAPTLVPGLPSTETIEDFLPLGGARDREPATPEGTARRPVTMADLTAINEGLKGWHIPPIDIASMLKPAPSPFAEPKSETEVEVSTESNGYDYGSNGYNGDYSNNDNERQHIGRIVATYIYRNHLGINHTKIEKRVSPKAKRAQYPQAFWVGQWATKKPTGWLKIPYRLPELLAALAQQSVPDVFLPEGEKDCDFLAALGLVVTTNSEGATPLKTKTGKWTPELNKWFHGARRLFILADNDEVGRAFAREKAQALASIVPDIRIIYFPEVPESEDVTWWLQHGHSKEELLARCEAAPRWQIDELESIRADQVIMRAIRWLWPKRFAVGKIGIVAGLPDEGKGQILCYIAARVTQGLEWPNGEGRSPQGNVIILSAEEDPEDSLTPRLVAAGADRSRIHFLKMVRDRDEKTGQPRKRMFSLVNDLERLRHKIIEVGNVQVVQIDPVSAYLGVGKVDSYRDSDVRAVLGPLKELAEEMRVAIITVMHFNKKVDITNALLRISNSLAFVGLPRHAYGVIADNENQRQLFVRAKNNDAAKADNLTLAFHFDVREVGADPDTGEIIRAPFIVWEPGYVDVTATEAMQAASEQKSPTTRDKAKQFLHAVLAAGPVLVEEITEAANAELISKRTLERAKEDLGVITEKDRTVPRGKWFWKLPQED